MTERQILRKEMDADARERRDETLSQIREFWRKGNVTNRIYFVDDDTNIRYSVHFGNKRVTSWVTSQEDPDNPFSRLDTKKGHIDDMLKVVWDRWDNISVYVNGHGLGQCNSYDVFYFILYIERQLGKIRRTQAQNNKQRDRSPESPKEIRERILELEKELELEQEKEQEKKPELPAGPGPGPDTNADTGKKEGEESPEDEKEQIDKKNIEFSDVIDDMITP